MADRPASRGPIDPGLQAERTTLAWERTAIAAMVAGLLLARDLADDLPVASLAGLAGTICGAVLLVWSSLQPDDPRPAPGASAARVGVVRLVGGVTVAFLAAALGLSLLVALTG